MADEQVISPRFSLKGWDVKVWLSNNIWMIKEVAKVIAPAIITFLSTQNSVLTVFVAGLGKLVLDTLEFYIKEQKE